MAELAFAARGQTLSPDGPKTIFHFTDETGHRVELLINGDIEADFIDQCRLYYTPDTGDVTNLAVTDLCGTETTFPSDPRVWTEETFTDPLLPTIDLTLEMPDTLMTWSNPEIAQELEWEFDRLVRATLDGSYASTQRTAT